MFNSTPCHTSRGLKSPYTLASIICINFHSMHPFGCGAYYRVPDANRKKLDARAQHAILLYPLSDGDGYVLWDLVSQKTLKSRDVIFEDENFPYLMSSSTSKHEVSPVDITWSTLQPVTMTSPVPAPLMSGSCSPSPASSSPSLAFNLQPGFDRWLEASIHNVPPEHEGIPELHHYRSPPSPQSSDSRASYPNDLASSPQSPVPSSTLDALGSPTSSVPPEALSPQPTPPPVTRRSASARQAPARYGD